jgi:imidazolonepropionase-like amidohydrolase
MAHRGELLIKGGTLVDIGGVRQSDVLIENSVIKDIGNISRRPGINCLDASGLFVAPGFIDCHVHLILNGKADVVDYVQTKTDEELAEIAAVNARKTLSSGITTVRDMGGKNYIEVGLRDSINNGDLPGPRLLVAGKMITSAGGHVRYIGREVSGQEDCRRAVREQAAKGVNFIKLMATGGLLTEDVKPDDVELDRDCLAIAVDEARRCGLYAAVHAHGLEGIRNAIYAGVHSIEHGSFSGREEIDAMIGKGIYWLPTLKALEDILRCAENAMPAYSRERASSCMESIKNTIGHGGRDIRIVFGTDAGTPFNYHGDNLRELELLVEHGIGNMQALASATTLAAELLGLGDKLGQLKVGFNGDCVLLRENPLDDIKNVRGVVNVIKSGEVVGMDY